MLRIFLLTIVVTCLAPAAGADTVVIQGQAIRAYDDALSGFRSICPEEIRKLYLADLEGKDAEMLLREENARLVVVIGPEALKVVEHIRNVPVLYLMVANPKQVAKGNRNMTGVAMTASPERYLDLLTRMKPRPRVVGVVYDPAKTGDLVRRAHLAAREKGLTLLAKEVNSRKEVPAALKELKGMIDVLWMIPDTTVVSPETTELLLLASPERNIPVISFSKAYVEMGALAALELDNFDQGRQAGKMANELLGGKPVLAVAGVEARSTTLKVNRTVARKLGVTLDP